MSSAEKPLSAVIADLFARATLTGEFADAALRRGLSLRAAPAAPGEMRSLLIWRGSKPLDANKFLLEARTCADAAGFPAFDHDYRLDGRGILLTERQRTADEEREAERYRREEPSGPWRPGRPAPESGALHLNTLYHLARSDGGWVSFYIRAEGGPLMVRGPNSTRDVPLGHAARFLRRLGYTPAGRLTVGGRLV